MKNNYVPEAPWIGKHREDYYGLKSAEEELEVEIAYDEYIDYLIDTEKEDRMLNGWN